MIINFKVKNFGSIKEEQILSFEAVKTDHLEEYYIINVAKYRLLKLGLIYGANASGKSTVLNALEFLRKLVLNPQERKTEALDFQPYLFDKHTVNESTIIAIEFIQNELRYDYVVEFTRRGIIREQLDNYNTKKANVFRRSTHKENQFTEIKFGSKIKVGKTSHKTLEANTLSNNTVLGGFLKTNIDIVELNEAINWFKNYLRPLVHTKTALEGYVSSKIEKHEVDKVDIIRILQKADLNISDIVIEEKVQEISTAFLSLFEEQLNLSEFGHKISKEKGRLTTLNVDFEHTIGAEKYTLPIELESLGTRRYYGFAGLLALLLKNAHLVPIDELESSLHPDLYTHFILSFLMNSKQSQLLATTHYRELLENKDMYRKDAIWFTDQSSSQGTELYSLSDFDSSVVRDTTNVLNAYRSGKLSAKPNLGDIYIE